MMRMLSILLMVAAMFFLSTSASDAGHPRRFRLWPHAHGAHKHEPGHHPHRHRVNSYDMYLAMYPKYYYGFHERHFYELGIPVGDRGLRGKPW